MKSGEGSPASPRPIVSSRHRDFFAQIDVLDGVEQTDAFFHRPDELADEFLNAGFQDVELVAIEGPGWLARDFDSLWNDPQQRARLLAAVRKVESEPSVLGASSHFMAIGRKPSSKQKAGSSA